MLMNVEEEYKNEENILTKKSFITKIGETENEQKGKMSWVG